MRVVNFEGVEQPREQYVQLRRWLGSTTTKKVYKFQQQKFLATKTKQNLSQPRKNPTKNNLTSNLINNLRKQWKKNNKKLNSNKINRHAKKILILWATQQQKQKQIGSKFESLIITPMLENNGDLLKSAPTITERQNSSK